MAHFEKFTRSAAGNILTHNTREDNEKHKKRNYTNENIDKGLTKNNYSLIEQNEKAIKKLNSTIEEVQQGRKLRKDAIVLVGFCITTPLDEQGKPTLTEEQEKQFFKCVNDYLLEKFPFVVSSDVHKDEFIKSENTVHSHLHYTFCPIVENEKGKRFCAKEVINRNMLKSFHSDLQKYLDKHLDFYCPITKEDNPNFTNLSMKEYKVKKELENLETSKKQELEKIENDYNDRFDYVEKHTFDKLNQLQEQYNSKAAEQKENYNNRISEFEEYTNQKLLECQNLINEKIKEFKNMCMKVNKKKEELKEYLKSSKDGYVAHEFRNLGTEIFGNRKVYNKEEIEHLTEKINTIEKKYDFYKQNQNIVEDLNKQHKNEIQGLLNKMERLKDNIQKLLDENIELKLYKNFVNDSISTSSDFDKYKDTKIIKEVQVFDYDIKNDRECMHTENRIFDIKDLSKEKESTKEKQKQKEKDNSIEL